MTGLSRTRGRSGPEPQSRPTQASSRRGRPAAWGALAVGVALLGGLGAAPAAAADPPGKVQIAVACGAETFAATSGQGGSAAWTATRDGERLVLLPVAVSGTVTAADGTVRAFSQELGRHDAGPAADCTFTFAMTDKAGDVRTIAGEGRFLLRPAPSAG